MTPTDRLAVREWVDHAVELATTLDDELSKAFAEFVVGDGTLARSVEFLLQDPYLFRIAST